MVLGKKSHNNPFQLKVEAVSGRKPVAYNPALAKITGSIKAGLLLSQLLYWWDKGIYRNWIYKTAEEIKRETELSRREQETAIRKCVEAGYITVRLAQVPAKRHFQLHIDLIVAAVEWQKRIDSVKLKETTQNG